MRINHNIAALNTYRQLGQANDMRSESMQKLSSGLRINSAADDAAGLAISEKMRGQIRGLEQAQTNAQDGISLIQTAEGALNETHSILQRMRELAVQAANDTNTDQDRGEIQKEINQLTSEINRIGNTTEFNTQNLLNGAKDSDTVAVAAGATGVTIGGVGGFEIGTGTLNAGDDLNDVTIKFTEGTTSGAAFSTDGQTLTVTLDSSSSTINATSIESLITATTTNVPTGVSMSAFTVTGGGTVDASTESVSLTADLTGGMDAGSGLQFQIGANENQSLTVEISDMRANALGLTGSGTGFTSDTKVTNGTDSTGVESALDVTSHDSAANAVTVIQQAINEVSAERSKLGATQNRLDHTINNLGTSAENLTAAESRIRDVDMAKEMMKQTKASILAQASQAMLAQANQMPQGVLQLLR
ncbi:flagellin [Virgibacillus necropolis]|uniref:flagellin N-terminal helical domain-containing protein n=1 Tax=Virgibacillus necropolis TaxID=163877 RepID=UPI00385153EA